MTAPRVDWFRVFTELDRMGYRLPMVAATLSIPYSTLVSRRNNGSEPRHADGEAILTLWCSVLSKPREAIPRVWVESLSAAGAKAGMKKPPAGSISVGLEPNAISRAER